ncbi:MAG: clostripain-related cysteine peptidase [Elusimicrobiota bacterium]|jgi:hypothetical protein
MLKKCLAVAAMCALLVSARPLAAEKIDLDQGLDLKGVLESLQAETAPTPAVSALEGRIPIPEWTVMVYVNAKNNLEQFGLADVNEMEEVGSTDKVKIVVELGRIAGYDGTDGNWVGQRRYVIRKDNNPKKISSLPLEKIPKADMGDWRHLVDFVKWAKATAPAKHYVLVVWNHGSGWSKMSADKLPNDAWIQGISYDDETGNHMTTPDMRLAMEKIGKVDIFASDACLMQMAEVGYQIKDYADYIVASEETEPGDGYTYDKFLGPLAAKADMSSLDLARLMAQAYTQHYAEINQAAQQSVVRAAALPQLLSKLTAWTVLAMNGKNGDKIKAAVSHAQSFAYNDNKDLLHFIQLVDSSAKDTSLKRYSAELENFIANEVVMGNNATGDKLANAKGLAIYLPGYGYNKDYDELTWAKDGGWSVFLKWLKDIKR